MKSLASNTGRFATLGENIGKSVGRRSGGASIGKPSALTKSLLRVLVCRGEMGFMRLEAGKNLLGIEGEIAWVTPGAFTVKNFPCAENGDNCGKAEPGGRMTQFYKDPAHNVAAIQERLTMHKKASQAVSDKRLRA